VVNEVSRPSIRGDGRYQEMKYTKQAISNTVRETGGLPVSQCKAGGKRKNTTRGTNMEMKIFIVPGFIEI
jgi:hypothetical protein